LSNTIERTVSIDSEPGVVFDALTSPELLGKWLCHEAKIDGKVGGTCQFGWATNDIGAPVIYAGSAEVIEIDPGKLLRLRLVGASASDISIEVSPADGKTELHLIHEGFENAQAHDTYSRGWTASLTALCSLIEDDPEERSRSAIMERTIPLPGHDPCVLTWQDGALWVSDSGGGISRVNPRTGTVETSFEFEGEPSGLAFDGEALWQADREDGVLVKLDVTTGRVMKRMAIGGLKGELTGLTWDGSHLWVGDAGEEQDDVPDRGQGSPDRPRLGW